MQPDIDDLNVAYHRAKLDRFGITFLTATTDPFWLKRLTRIAESTAKNAEPGKPAPQPLARYKD